MPLFYEKGYVSPNMAGISRQQEPDVGALRAPEEPGMEFGFASEANVKTAEAALQHVFMIAQGELITVQYFE